MGKCCSRDTAPKYDKLQQPSPKHKEESPSTTQTNAVILRTNEVDINANNDKILNDVDKTNYSFLVNIIIVDYKEHYYERQTINCHDTDSITSIKTKLIQKLNIESDKYRFKIVYDGKILTQDQMTFKGYNIAPNSVKLYALRKKIYIVKDTDMKIFVICMQTRKTITLCVTSDELIADVKRQIEDKLENAPCHRQRLIFVGNELQDTLKLHHYHIKNESTLHVITQFIGNMKSMMYDNIEREDFWMNKVEKIRIKKEEFVSLIDNKFPKSVCYL
eukprot:269860_1